MRACKHTQHDIVGGKAAAMKHILVFQDGALHLWLFKFRSLQVIRCVYLATQRHGRLTCAGHRRRVGDSSVVAVLAITAPGALTVIEAVRWTARTLKVFGGRLVETTTTCCGRE